VIPPWWRHHFDDVYHRLHDPFFPEEQSRQEAAAILELLGLSVGSRVLDLPCGWGRHTLLLPEGGVEAFGADLSPSFLKRAADGARERKLPVRFAAADLRYLPFAEASFDAVVNIYTSLGLFLRDEDDIAALAEVRRLLRPGGRFLVESMHRDEVLASYAERDRWRLPDGTQVQVRRRFDPVAGISHERMRWRRGEERGEKRHALRLRTATEIDALLRAAGLDPVAWWGGWYGEPLRHDSPHVVVLARRDRSTA
jgi:ubiquinone/menaquinone biosynthesis C-methylase UbiE